MIMKYLQVLEVQPGGWLLLAVIYFFLELDVFLIVLLCVLIHETGHLIMLDWFQIKVRRINLDLTGLSIQFNEAKLQGIKGAITAAAGPSAGITAAVLGSFVGNAIENEQLLLFAGSNLALSLFNLLPAKPLDGWRILYSIVPTVSYVLSVLTSVIVLALGVWLMFEGFGTALALMGVLLLLQDAEMPKRSVRRGIC